MGRLATGGRPARRAARRLSWLGRTVALGLFAGLAVAAPVAVAQEPTAAPPNLADLGLPRVAGVTIGLTTGCLWGEDGSVWCWGSNHNGELGVGTTSDDWASVPVRVEGIPGRVRQLEADEQTTCALTDAGGVWCWGENFQGEVGDGTTENRLAPTLVTGLDRGAIALAPVDFGDHRCAVLSDGGAVCWGDNGSRQLGAGTWEDHGPIRVTVMTGKIVAMATTAYRTCAVTAAGALRCWGQLWVDPTGKTEGTAAADAEVLTPRGLGTGVTDVALADDTACALLTNGDVRCWSWGQTWEGSELVPAFAWKPGQVPEAVPGLPGGMETIHLSHYAWSEASEPNTLLITTSACATRGGDAWCWGGNRGGQLGDGTTTDRPTPVPIQTRDIAQLSTTWGESLALLGDGSLLTWGHDDPTPRSPFWLTAAPSSGYRPPDILVPVITTTIPTPADVSTSPPVVGANLLLAAFAMIVFTISTEILNRSLGRLDPVLVRRFRPVYWLDRGRARLDAALPGRFAGLGHTRLADAMRLLGIVVFYGIVFSLLDPTWDPFSITGLWLVLIMAVAFGLVGLSGDIAAWAAARRWGVAGDLAVRPGSLAAAVGSTLLSRALVLVPGVMIGSPEALDIDAERTDRRRLGGLAGVGLGTVMAIGLVAWLGSLVTATFEGTGGSGAELVRGIGACLLLVFAGAVQNGFVQLLSLRESAGLALRRTHRVPWAIAMLAVSFLFWHTLVNPRGDLAEAMTSTNVLAFLAVVAIVFVAAVVAWGATMVSQRRAAASPVPAGGGAMRGEGPAAAAVPEKAAAPAGEAAPAQAAASYAQAAASCAQAAALPAQAAAAPAGEAAPEPVEGVRPRPVVAAGPAVTVVTGSSAMPPPPPPAVPLPISPRSPSLAATPPPMRSTPIPAVSTVAAGPAIDPGTCSAPTSLEAEPSATPAARAIAFCPACGTRRKEGTRYCTACGVAFETFVRGQGVTAR